MALGLAGSGEVAAGVQPPPGHSQAVQLALTAPHAPCLLPSPPPPQNPQVESLLAKGENLHESFRLFITAEPHPAFPIGLLQAGWGGRLAAAARRMFGGPAQHASRAKPLVCMRAHPPPCLPPTH